MNRELKKRVIDWARRVWHGEKEFNERYGEKVAAANHDPEFVKFLDRFYSSFANLASPDSEFMAYEAWQTAKNAKGITFASIADLADALIRAKDAHVAFESKFGVDQNWPLWYASYMAMEQGIGDKPSKCSGPSCAPNQVKSTPSWGFGSDDGSKIDLGKEEEQYWKAHE